MKVQLDLFPFPVSIRRSSRARRMAIHVEQAGKVELVLPKRASEASGMAFLQERQEWIVQILEKQKSDSRAISVAQLREGVSLPFFGDSLRLRIHVDPKRSRSFLEEKNGELVARLPNTSKLRDAISRFYIAQAKQYFIGQSHEYGQQIGKKIARVRVIDMKTQWGSCNHRTHTLTFNWRLALAPEPIARYVAAHEVAHIVHPNHSLKFWALVATLDPVYARSRAWLKQYGGSLFLK